VVSVNARKSGALGQLEQVLSVGPVLDPSTRGQPFAIGQKISKPKLMGLTRYIKEQTI